MNSYFQELSVAEQDKLKKAIQELFKQTCILKIKCDPATLIERDNISYEVCERHRGFISDYLSVLDCELVHDPQEHIFRIAGEGILIEKMSLMTTKLFIILKIIYRDKIMGAGLQETVTNLAEIREYGSNTNLITRKLTAQEIYDAINLMKTHQIIEIPGAIGNIEDNTPIYIYSTINMYLKSSDISELIAEYKTEIESIIDSEEESYEAG